MTSRLQHRSSDTGVKSPGGSHNKTGSPSTPTPTSGTIPTRQAALPSTFPRRINRSLPSRLPQNSVETLQSYFENTGMSASCCRELSCLTSLTFPTPAYNASIPYQSFGVKPRLLSFQSSSLIMCLGREGIMFQMLRSLLPTWEKDGVPIYWL